MYHTIVGPTLANCEVSVDQLSKISALPIIPVNHLPMMAFDWAFVNLSFVYQLTNPQH